MGLCAGSCSATAAESHAQEVIVSPQKIVHDDGQARRSQSSSLSPCSDLMSVTTTAPSDCSTDELRVAPSETPSSPRLDASFDSLQAHFTFDAIQEAVRASEQMKLLRAVKILEDARVPLSSVPALSELASRSQRVRDVLHDLSSARLESPGWKSFEMESVTFWRRWDPDNQALEIVSSWESRGSLLQQVAVIRDAEIAEPLWNGQCWDIWAQHAPGVSLVRWLQKDPITGRKLENIVERVLCDCLDEDTPCWVLLERTPDIPGYEGFCGTWGPFNIPVKPKGFERSTRPLSGRIIRPISPSTTRTVLGERVVLPAAIRWFCTDRVLLVAMRLIASGLLKSWNDIIDGWDKSEYDTRISEQSSFYDPISDSVQNHLLLN